MEFGMMMINQSEIPIELECWMLKNGVMSSEHRPANPDIVWPKEETEHARALRTGISSSWKPAVDNEQPPF